MNSNKFVYKDGEIVDIIHDNPKSVTSIMKGRKVMKTRIIIASFLLVVLCLTTPSYAQVPQMINYQGTVTDASGNPLNGGYNMTFSIYDVSSGGTALWTQTQNGVSVTNGVFNVLLPVPYGKFNGQLRYLGIAIAPDPEMTPRREIVSVPYAYTDGDWTFRITDTADTTLMTVGAWGIARYGNSLYGIADSTHVNLGVGSTTGRIGQNFKYCTVSGGLMNSASGNVATVGGGRYHIAGGDYATIGGGDENGAGGNDATIGGGAGNTADGSSATVGGGANNNTSGNYATIGGGRDNLSSNFEAVVGGGRSNTASGNTSTVGGGVGNTASGDYGTIAGGDHNTANYYATVGGGRSNTANHQYVTIGGGYGNTANAGQATVGGGDHNTANGWYSTIGGGDNNYTEGQSATIPGGLADTVDGDYSFAAGDRVRITSAGDYTFAFGSNFTTSASHAVIFHDTSIPIKVGIGTTSPQGALDVNSTTGAFIVPRMTTAQRNALPPVNGMIIYNTITNQFNFYENGAWVTK